MHSMNDNLPNKEHNPFQAPVTLFEEVESSDSPVEATRRKYLSHETSVKSVGALCLLGGLFGLFTAFMLVTVSPGGAAADASVLVLPGFVFAMAILQLVTAYGLQKLQPWARIVTGIFSAIGLTGFPVGTLICGYILYLLFSAKGAMVFSYEYRQVIAQTPHIKYKTSPVLWIALIILLGLIGLAVIGTLFST
jgi:hypothetical protein